jgi:guanylate kinase
MKGESAMAGPFLFIFTGTGGSGRKTIGNRVGEELGLCPVPSYTTRPPRATDASGRPDRDYHFITREQFQELEHSDEFVETVTINRERYGVRRADVENALYHANCNAYVIVNPEGAEALKKRYGSTVIRIFLYTDKATVRARLEAKGLSFEVADRYLDVYAEEVIYRKQCEHVIENLELLPTLARIREAIQSHL